MSHISKGDVHAYLDGALGAYPEEVAKHVRDHLDACAECAQLLADERRLRQEASSVLAGSAQGAVELDPFEELLARAATPAERTERTRPSLGRRTQMLGWAATIVISIGSGWMARELTGPGGDVARAAGVERVVDAQRAVGEIGARQDRQDLERDNTGRLTEAESPGEPPATAEVAEAVEANRAVGGTGGGAVPGARGLDDDAVLDQVQAPRAQRRELLVPARDLEPTSLSDELRGSAISSAPTPAPAQPQDPPDVGGLGAGTTQRSFARLTPSTLPFRVPGLRIRDVRLAPRGDGLAGGSGSTVVVTQELADGRVVELQFVPQTGSDPELESALRERRETVDSALPEGWALAVREVPGGVATLAGPLTEPELADLLDRALGLR
jgi:hypothetical protein